MIPRQATKTAFRKASATHRVIPILPISCNSSKSARAGIQRGLQKSAHHRSISTGGFKTGAAGLAGLAGYGAYKQEKARGASDARASLRGAVKGAGAYLGAKGGIKLAQNFLEVVVLEGSCGCCSWIYGTLTTC